MLSRQDLVEIVERSSSPAERVAAGFTFDQLPEDEAQVTARLDRWRRLAAPDSLADFERRLAFDGFDLNTARRSLGRARLPADHPLPAWAETLSAALEAVASPERSPTDFARARGDSDRPIPFAELLVLFVRVARARVAARAGKAASHLTEAASAALERRLLQRLARLCEGTLELEFAAFRLTRQSSLERLLGATKNDAARELYDQFIARMLSGEIRVFLRRYPALARLVSTLTDFWVDAVAEFLVRLDADRDVLEETFSAGARLGRVAAIETGLSDPHNQWRSALAVIFECGVTVMYKARDLELEAGYFGLLAWLNEHGSPLDFKLLRVIRRAGYGWVEFAEHRPCVEAREAERYYRRAGMLLAVVSVLGGTDFHEQNVVASGEQPILVDLETLFSHRIRPFDSSASVEADGHDQHSILATGLLPQWLVGAEGRCIDTSGLGRCASGFADRIVEGFREMYSLLLRRRAELLAHDGPLVPLAGQRVRFVFRPTIVYARLLESALEPAHLRDGADLAITFDSLSRYLLRNRADRRFWSLQRHERQALERMDVPFFSARADSADLPLTADETLTDCFTAPAIDLAISRINALSDADLDRQVALIRAALYTRVTRDEGAPDGRRSADLEPQAHPATPLDPHVLIERAVAIGEELDRQAIRESDGRVAWLGLQYVSWANRFELRPLGPALYDGSCGVALFLAALEHVTANPRWREIALGAIQSVRRDLRDDPRRLADIFGIGGGTGLGSIVYAFVRIGRLLADATLIDDAARAAAQITAERIEAAQSPDVLTGTAGALLGLLALHDVTADEHLLEQARACGQRLIAHRVAARSGLRTWRNPGMRPLVGFSHGAAGIAYALLRLHAVAPDSALPEAALEAVAYEATMFRPEAGNWIDLRHCTEDGEPVFRAAWCSGAAGIALARLGGLAMLDTPQIRADIDIGLQTTQRMGRSGIDQLCCGDLGRAEVLLSGALRLSRPELFEAARWHATHVVTTADHAGGFHLGPNLPEGVQFPGFFYGTAGIGYELLRLAGPERLSSALLWE